VPGRMKTPGLTESLVDQFPVDVFAVGQDDGPDLFGGVSSSFGNDEACLSIGKRLVQVVPHVEASAIDFFCHFAAGHVVVFAQNACGHVCCAG